MIGKSLGPYEILETLGAGGMGEVYLAEDTRLKRKVAVKVLPSEFAGDPQRLARFEQEARAAAGLNHPHIAAVFDVGFEPDDGLADAAAGPERSAPDAEEASVATGTHYMVQELLEGDTLGARLDKGRLSLGPALELATEVAEALAAAHAAGIIHRDLKPANIFVTPESHAKVLDFGLAKLTEVAAFGSGSDPGRPQASKSPTMLGTVAGQVMGTAGYMAPEQVESGEIDHRADLFSFGCVLYQMVSGKQPFAGRSVMQTLDLIVHEEPEPVIEVDPELPAQLHWIIRKCLAKDPARRYQGAGDLAVDLRALTADVEAGVAMSAAGVGPAGAGAAGAGAEEGGTDTAARGWAGAVGTGRAMPLRLAVPAGVLIALIAALGVWILMRPPPVPLQELVQFDVPLPEGVVFTYTGRHSVAYSPDGQNIVFSAGAQLYRRNLSERQAVPIRGTENGARSAFFSPDGEWVGFWHSDNDGELRKIPIDGGLALTLCPANNPWGARWLDDGTILFGQGSEGILRVSEDGGEPELLIPVGEGELAHGPQPLPGANDVLFTLRTGPGDWDDADAVVYSLDTGEQTVLFSGGSDAQYLPTGHIVYVRNGALLARPFDPGTRQAGAAVVLREGVAQAISNLTGAGHFAISDRGALAYVPGGARGLEDAAFGWVDRNGDFEIVDVKSGMIEPRLSPDERFIAAEIMGELGDNVEIFDISRELWTRLTTEGDGNEPVWSADGRYVYFASIRDGYEALYRRAVDRSSAAELVWAPDDQEAGFEPHSVTADGRFLTLTHYVGSGDVLLLEAGDQVTARPLIEGPISERDAVIHPSGRWIAYVSNETGRYEIYVREIATGRQWSISGNEAYEPTWSRDGKELFYRVQDRRLMVVDVDTEPEFRPSAPRVLVENFMNSAPAFRANYDPASDGRFLAALTQSASAGTGSVGLRVILNWGDEVKRRVPVEQ